MRLDQYLFENQLAYERFKLRVEQGKNPIDPSDEEAAPASPTKTVETKTVKEEKMPEKEVEEGEEEKEEQKNEGGDVFLDWDNLN